MVANIRELLRDEREWCVAARVEVLKGQSSHFEVNEEGDLIVSCITLLHGVPIWANLDTLAGGADGSGVWFIPDPGTEVKIGFDHGDFEGEAYILMRGSAGKAPQGLTSGTVFILGANVQIRTPGGTATKLPTLADHNALKSKVNDLIDKYNGHKHLGVTTGAGISGLPQLTDLESGHASDPTGTSVIEVE